MYTNGPTHKFCIMIVNNNNNEKKALPPLLLKVEVIKEYDVASQPIGLKFLNK